MRTRKPVTFNAKSVTSGIEPGRVAKYYCNYRSVFDYLLTTYNKMNLLYQWNIQPIFLYETKGGQGEQKIVDHQRIEKKQTMSCSSKKCIAIPIHFCGKKSSDTRMSACGYKFCKDHIIEVIQGNFQCTKCNTWDRNFNFVTFFIFLYMLIGFLMIGPSKFL